MGELYLRETIEVESSNTDMEKSGYDARLIDAGEVAESKSSTYR